MKKNLIIIAGFIIIILPFFNFGQIRAKKPVAKKFGLKPSITIQQPNGGEKWQIGGPNQNITWTSSGITSGKFRILLFKGARKMGAIASGISCSNGEHSYNWQVGRLQRGIFVPTGTDYKIKIRQQGKSPHDFSDSYFTISEKSKKTTSKSIGNSDSDFKSTRARGKKTQLSARKFGSQAIIKKITVLSPTGGNYETGQYLPIRWKTSWKSGPEEFFTLELYSGSGKRFKRIIKTPVLPFGAGGGSAKHYGDKFTWPIPGDIWPEFYTIRVSQGSALVGFSGRFHISRSYKTTSKSIKIEGWPTNTWGYYVKGEIGDVKCKNHNPELPMAPGKMRVGKTRVEVKSADVTIYFFYRCFVGFNLRDIPKGSIIERASLHYHRFYGLDCSPKVYVLNQKWKKGEGLSTAKATYHRDNSDFKDVVINWLAFPDDNYGIFFKVPDDHDGGICISRYENIHLQVTFRAPKK